MTPEQHNIPDWAHQDRQADYAWIGENLNIFWAAATDAFEDAGRGAIVVDTTSLPVPGAGHPFGYFSQEQIHEYGDGDTKRIVAEYDPARELVLVLLKSGTRSSTYRVGTLQAQVQETSASITTAVDSPEQEVRPELQAPISRPSLRGRRTVAVKRRALTTAG